MEEEKIEIAVLDADGHSSNENKGKIVKPACNKHPETSADQAGRPLFSFWALLAKSSVYRVAMVLGAMILTEMILFFASGQKSNGVSEAFFNRVVSVVFMGALGLVFFLLMHIEQEMGAKAQYTLRRFRLSGAGIFFTEVFYNLLCLILVFAAQVWLSIGMLQIGDSHLGQNIFLAFYRIDFLHSLLPMADGERWFRNILLIFSFSLGTACGFGKRDYVLPSLTLVWTICWFVHPIGRSFGDFACNILYILGILSGFRRAWELQRLEAVESA